MSNPGPKRKSPSYRLQTTVSQAYVEPLQFLQTLFGGSIGVQDRSNNLSKNPIYRWYLYGDNARDFLIKIKPYLKVKTQQSSIGIRFQNSRKKYQNQPMTQEYTDFGFLMYSEMSRLNKVRQVI